jgi:hypothetical protein
MNRTSLQSVKRNHRSFIPAPALALSLCAAHPASSAEGSNRSSTFHVGLIGGNLATERASFESPVGFGGIQLGRSWRRARWDLDLLGWRQGFPDSAVSLTGAAVDVSGRLLLRPGRVLGIAPMAGVRFETLFGTVPIEQGIMSVHPLWDVHTLGTDGVDAWAPYLGMAVTVVDRAHFQIAGVVKSGMRYYNGRTAHGQRLDLFRPAGFVQFGIETTFPF